MKGATNHGRKNKIATPHRRIRKENPRGAAAIKAAGKEADQSLIAERGNPQYGGYPAEY